MQIKENKNKLNDPFTSINSNSNGINFNSNNTIIPKSNFNSDMPESFKKALNYDKKPIEEVVLII